MGIRKGRGCWINIFFIGIGFALAEASTAGAVSPSFADGYVALRDGRVDEAVQLLQKAVTEDPQYPQTYIFLAQAEEILARYDAAAANLGKYCAFGLKDAPEASRHATYLERAQQFLAPQKLVSAAKRLSDLETLTEDRYFAGVVTYRAHRQLADIFLSEKKHGDAMPHYDAVAAAPGYLLAFVYDTDARLRHAQACAGAEKFAVAEAILEHLKPEGAVTEELITQAKWDNYLRQTQFLLRNDPAMALQAATASLRYATTPEQQEESRKLLAESTLAGQEASAQKTVEDGKYTEASAQFQGIAAQRPDDPRAPEWLMRSARALYRTGRDAAGVLKILDQVITQHPQSLQAAEARYLKGRVHELDLRDLAKAIDLYELCARVDADNVYGRDAAAAAARLRKGRAPDK